jgi:hypothetical protein
MTLRHSADVCGNYTQNFYADVCGNLGTGYLGTGLPVWGWLAENDANTQYAYVTKWYDQAMDICFNCATQYALASQPIYDVSYGLINFGYTGTAGGGVVAPQTNCFLNLPSSIGLNNGDISFSNTFKTYNMATGGTEGIFQLGPSKSFGQEILAVLNSTNQWQYAWYGTNYGTSTYAANSVVSMTYTAGLGSSSGMNVYVGGTNTGPFSPGALNYTNTGNTNVIGYYVGASSNNYMNGQMYYFYMSNVSLVPADRVLLESTPSSVPTYVAFMAVTTLSVSSTGMTLTWSVPAGASSYTYYINDAAVVPNSLTGTTTLTAVFSSLTINGPNNIVVSAYDVNGILIAEGMTMAALYNFAAPVIVGGGIFINPPNIPGWTLSGTIASYANLTGTNGTYGNYAINGSTAIGYSAACPYGQYFGCQFYGAATNTFTITSNAMPMTARTYTVSFAASTRNIFNPAQVMTVSLAGGSKNTASTFTVSNTGYSWTTLSFTCTPAVAGNYKLTVTWTTSNATDTLISIANISVI